MRIEERLEAPEPARAQRRRARTRRPVLAARTLETLAASSTLLDAHLAPAAPRDSARRRALLTADVGALLLAGLFASTLTSGGRPTAHWLPLIALVPLWVLIHKLRGLYDRDIHLIHKSTLDELPRLFESALVGIAAVWLVAPLLDIELHREEVLALAAFTAILLPAVRAIARTRVRRQFAPERCVIIGSGTVARVVAVKLEAHREHGVQLVGYVDGITATSGIDQGVPWLGELGDLERICHEHDVERVVLAFSSISHEQMLDVIRASKHLGLKVTVVPRLFEMLGHAVQLDEVGGMTLLALRGLGRRRSSLIVKRTIDVLGAGVGLVAVAPLLAAIAVAVKLSSPGPVLFAQRRMGRGNRPFMMLKFRTMVDGADALKAQLAHLNEAQAPMFKVADDPRVTPVGRFLRATSLDELPQLVNVLRGDMSLVGPRPLVPDENDHLVGWHRTRLELTPGLTGPWQVLGRTAIPFDEMVKLDYHYVADWSLWNDVKLLLRTVPVVLGRRGV